MSSKEVWLSPSFSPKGNLRGKRCRSSWRPGNWCGFGRWVLNPMERVSFFCFFLVSQNLQLKVQQCFIGDLHLYIVYFILSLHAYKCNCVHRITTAEQNESTFFSLIVFSFESSLNNVENLKKYVGQSLHLHGSSLNS